MFDEAVEAGEGRIGEALPEFRPCVRFGVGDGGIVGEGVEDDVLSVSGAPQIAQMVGSLAGSGRWVAFRRRRMSSMTGLGRSGVAVWAFIACP